MVKLVVGACRFLPSVAGQVQARIHDVDFVAGNAQIAGHEIGIGTTGGDKTVNLATVLANERQNALLVRRRERFGENVVALERTQNRHAGQVLSQFMHQPR